MCAYNEAVDPMRYRRLAQAFGVDDRPFSALVGDLCWDLGLKARMRDFNFDDADRERVVEIAMRSDNVLANPRPVDGAALRALLDQVR
jgi:alcohol dehydrogenase